MELPSLIQEFYRDRAVLITGATGFVGKVLVEKLLRSCPEIGNIYVLIRPTSECTSNTRLDHLLNSKVFNHIQKERPEALNRIIPISGDLTLPDLDLSCADSKTVLENVSIVFHVAASVKFTEDLKTVVNMNVIGTKRIVELSKKMQNLEAFIHVSTAYSNCIRNSINEEIYSQHLKPDAVIECSKWIDDKTLQEITPNLIRPHPNTYTFSKALAEQIVAEGSENIPAAIIRPSIVTSSLREPFPGWIDAIHGITGWSIAAGKGIIRTVFCDEDMKVDIIPVDIVVNLMITAAWNVAISKPDNPLVYNCTTGSINPITWGNFRTLGMQTIYKYPFTSTYWFPGSKLNRHKICHYLFSFFFEAVPASIMDIMCIVLGKKPIMLKAYKKLVKALEAIEFFTTHEYKFSNQNVLKLFASLNEKDKTIFDFDVSKIHWPTYAKVYILGTRENILKEDIKNLPNARKHLKLLYVIHIIFKTFTVFVTIRFFIRRLKLSRRIYFDLLKILMKIRDAAQEIFTFTQNRILSQGMISGIL